MRRLRNYTLAFGLGLVFAYLLVSSFSSAASDRDSVVSKRADALEAAIAAGR